MVSLRATRSNFGDSRIRLPSVPAITRDWFLSHQCVESFTKLVHVISMFEMVESVQLACSPGILVFHGMFCDLEIDSLGCSS